MIFLIKLKFEDAMQKYKNYMLSEETSISTVKVHMYAIKRFLNWCKNTQGYEYIEDIPLDIMVDYRLYLKKKNSKEGTGAGGNSSNTYISYIKSFFKLLFEMNYTEKDLSGACKFYKTKTAQNIQGIRQSKYVEDSGGFITEEQRDAILETALQTPCGERNRMMLYTAFACGLRESEVVALKYSDIDFARKTMTVKGKGNKRRKFFIGSQKYLSELKEYIAKNDLINGEYLFCNSRRDKYKPISVSQFTKIFKEVLGLAGIPVGKANGGFTTHDFRRTHITARLEAGGVISDIAKDVGHSNTETTQRYFKPKNNDEKLKNIQEQYQMAGLI